MTVVTKEGKVYDCFGVKDAVFPDADLGDEIVGAVISHNHPIDVTEYSFSKADLNSFMDYKLLELKGVDEKYTYVFNRNPNDIDLQSDDWQNIENIHSNMIELAHKYGIGYRRYKNDES